MVWLLIEKISSHFTIYIIKGTSFPSYKPQSFNPNVSYYEDDSKLSLYNGEALRTLPSGYQPEIKYNTPDRYINIY